MGGHRALLPLPAAHGGGYLENMKKLTDRQLSRLLATRICFHYADAERPWVREGIPAWPRRPVVAEDYASYFVPTEFHAIGAFSYSWSPFPECVSLGRYCSVAQGVEIMPPAHPTDVFTTSSMLYDPLLLHRRNFYRDHGHRNDDTVARAHPTNGRDITIGHDVYIATGAKLRGGVSIGDGAIVGAYSVVTRDVPPYAVVAGNPGRIVRMRYGDEQIARLRRLAWWNYDFRDVLRHAPLDDMDLFLDRMEALAGGGDLCPFVPARHDLQALLAREAA